MGSTHETDLVLTQPTPAERIKTYTSTYANWGAALELDEYIRREAYMTTVPVSRNGGITQWILTDPTCPPDARPILSSCESIRKNVLVAKPDGTVVDAITHAVGSVFTDPAHRGNGYASIMMNMVGPQLARWQGAEMKRGETWGDIRDGEVACSVLYSDIGKKFYAKHGWNPYESTHLEFPPQAAAAGVPEGGESSSPREAAPLGYHELAELCAVDERLIRANLAKKSNKTRVSLIPDLDAMLWHLMREDYMTKHIFGETPTVRGGVVGEHGSRVWAVWTRGYYGGLKKPEGNTMHILRLAIEDETSGDEYVQEAIEALLRLVRAQAAEWKVNNVEMWNPEPRIRGLIEKAGIPHEFVERENDSIASLMWYGQGEVEWVLNEKFGWC
ncbi:lysine acetyltransferase [Colletotrichum orchidophilum]|uniref:Lysine acetyltransferase n=1 Tax=Colletotrichum orchidophilum TaxID=1209926 RepID=A0A1G4B7F9_9PEZI|nr:lysine acetyltransferase [Colletotrichum orchidophilum]OHE97347.1 lysine acetyltransferase [Colletotrichum orchidophilum]